MNIRAGLIRIHPRKSARAAVSEFDQRPHPPQVGSETHQIPFAGRSGDPHELHEQSLEVIEMPLAELAAETPHRLRACGQCCVTRKTPLPYA